jgi:glycosyltransferase involved in cell wall biosynthesis
MARTFIDISDVIVYFSYNASISGIQRVQLELIRHLSSRPTCAFVVENAGLEGFVVVDNALLSRFVGFIDGGVPTRRELNALLQEIRASKTVAIPKADEIFFVPGAFWVSSSTMRCCWNAKAQGARIGVLCHDLIPLTRPEFCEESLVDVFTAAVDSIFHVVDFVVAVSDYVRRDVERHLRDIRLSVPVTTLLEAHELAAAKGEPKLRPAVRDVIGKRYVLFVSTIEARKNHAYTLTLWQRLLARLPAGEVPDLVWVGRPGWMVDDLMTRVGRLGYLGGKLHILSQLSDNELRALYQGCWFTIYPSLAEGWGLPVAESLMFGKPCVASNSSSIPEVGGDFVWYVDPLNVTEGVDLVTALIAHPERVEAAAQRIRQDFKPRTWAGVAANLLTSLEAAKAYPRREVAVDMALSPGIVYRLGGKRDKNSHLTSPERAALDLMFDDGWHGVEPWGRWLKGQIGALRLSRQAAQPERPELPEPCNVLLIVNAVEFWRGQRLLLTCPQAGQEAVLQPQAATEHGYCVRMILPPGPLDFTFCVDRADVGGGADHRALSVGLVAFGFAPVADTAACQALLDHLGSSQPLMIDAKLIGSAAPIRLRAVSPRTRWLTHIAKRAMNENPLTTASRIVRRIKIHLVG